jgi:tetratricopeptide (TPR) repeat protein
MLVSVWYGRGDCNRALDHAHRALACYEAIGHRFGQASGFNDIGYMLATLGKYEEALPSAQRALALLQQEPRDDVGAAATWDTIAYIQTKIGQYEQAEESYRRALELLRTLGGDRSEEAGILTRLGDVLLASGQPDAAAGAWQQALGLFTEADEQQAASVKARLGQLEAGPD